LVKLIEYCFDHQIFVILKLSRKYIIFIFLAAVVNQSSHLTSISDHFSYVTLKNLMIKRGTYRSLLEIWLVEKVDYILTSLSYKNSDENCMNMYYIYKICNLTFNSHKYLTKYDDNFLQLHVFVCFCLFFVLFFRFYFLLLLAYIFLLLDIICV
jgi:hypothetical protein